MEGHHVQKVVQRVRWLKRAKREETQSDMLDGDPIILGQNNTIVSTPTA